MNIIYCKDNLEILNKFYNTHGQFIDLIYIDPPFFSQKNYTLKNGNVAFKDTWKSRNEYLEMLRVRVIAMHKVLKDTGSFYLHCDPTMSHYLKILLDIIFGHRNFRNEIVWCYRGGGTPRKDFARKHDIIFRYSKTDKYIFNIDLIRIPYSKDSQERLKYKAKSFRRNKVYNNYEPNSKGKHPEDWLTEIQPIMPSSKKRLYPTQKPDPLLEKIIKASSNEGDLVADFFCGCGTTLAVAKKLNRQYIGVDSNPEAIKITERRLDSLRTLFN